MGAGILISDVDLGLTTASRPDGVARPAAIVPKGWCPSLFDPMAAGDGLLARVKPRVHGLSAADLRAIADAAARYGSGRIEITNRANLQIRGLSPETAPLFAAAILEAGLASPDPAAEARRNIMLPSHPTPTLLALAAEVEHWLETDGALVGLPAKFGFAVDEGEADPDRPQADITLTLLASGVAIGIAGDDCRFVCDQPVAIAQTVTRAFLALAAAQAKPPRRMAALVALVGADAVWAYASIQPSTGSTDALPSPLRGGAGGGGPSGSSESVPPGRPPSGLPLHSGHLPRKGEGSVVADRIFQPGTGPLSRTGEGQGEGMPSPDMSDPHPNPLPSGRGSAAVLPSPLCASHPHPEVLEPAQPGRASKDGPAPSASVLRGSAVGRAPQEEEVELALPFGAADAAMLVAAADLAEHFGDGTLRVTTTRRLVLTGANTNPAIRAEAAAAGFITDPDDPRLHMAACAGRPACPSGWADVRKDAARLAPAWRERETLHVSGCAKGCAHPGPAVMTLVATPTGYDLVRNGRAGGSPDRTGLTLAQVETLLAERPTVSL